MSSSGVTEILTSRQRELLELIESSVGREGRMPSYREMALALGVSAVGTIQDHIEVLVKCGYLEKSKKGKKTLLKLAGHRQSPMVAVPIVGEVAAGSLRDAFEVALGSLPVSLAQLGGRAAKAGAQFALRITGESMIDAGILPGDMIVVDRAARVKSGDIAVVDRNGESTVKEIQFPQKNEKGIRLVPHNKALKTVVIPESEENFRIVGKVISVQRFL